MPRLTQAAVREALEKGLRLREPEFRLETYMGRVNGSVISQTFKGKGDHRRVVMVRDALEKVLGVEGERKVGMILAYTPDEWYIGSDEVRPKPKRPRRQAIPSGK